MLLFLRTRNTRGLGEPANNPWKIHGYYRMLGPASSVSLHPNRLQRHGSAVGRPLPTPKQRQAFSLTHYWGNLCWSRHRHVSPGETKIVDLLECGLLLRPAQEFFPQEQDGAFPARRKAEDAVWERGLHPWSHLSPSLEAEDLTLLILSSFPHISTGKEIHKGRHRAFSPIWTQRGEKGDQVSSSSHTTYWQLGDLGRSFISPHPTPKPPFFSHL